MTLSLRHVSGGSELTPTKDIPYLALSEELWVPIVRILEKFDRVITAPHCTYRGRSLRAWRWWRHRRRHVTFRADQGRHRWGNFRALHLDRGFDLEGRRQWSGHWKRRYGVRRLKNKRQIFNPGNTKLFFFKIIFYYLKCVQIKRKDSDKIYTTATAYRIIIPTGTRRNNNVIMTLKWRCDVVLAS